MIGFADLQTSYLPFCTLEGTKEVLGLQSGRYLVKFVPYLNFSDTSEEQQHQQQKLKHKQILGGLGKNISRVNDRFQTLQNIDNASALTAAENLVHSAPSILYLFRRSKQQRWEQKQMSAEVVSLASRN